MIRAHSRFIKDFKSRNSRLCDSPRNSQEIRNEAAKMPAEFARRRGRESAVMKKQAWLLMFFLLSFSAVSLAQGLGSIVGTVTDPSGAVLSGAKITATEIGTGLVRATTADSQGYYVISSLKPAQYMVSIESSGFRTSKQEVTLLANQALTLNGTLSLGAPTEIVEVTGTGVQVDTSTSTLKNVRSEERRVGQV